MIASAGILRNHRRDRYHGLLWMLLVLTVMLATPSTITASEHEIQVEEPFLSEESERELNSDAQEVQESVLEQNEEVVSSPEGEVPTPQDSEPSIKQDGTLSIQEEEPSPQVNPDNIRVQSTERSSTIIKYQDVAPPNFPRIHSTGQRPDVRGLINQLGETIKGEGDKAPEVPEVEHKPIDEPEPTIKAEEPQELPEVEHKPIEDEPKPKTMAEEPKRKEAEEEPERREPAIKAKAEEEPISRKVKAEIKTDKPAPDAVALSETRKPNNALKLGIMAGVAVMLITVTALISIGIFQSTKPLKFRKPKI